MSAAQYLGEMVAVVACHMPMKLAVFAILVLMQVATFRLPMNNAAPVVMVAAGTGFAPLRGFLQANATTSARSLPV